MSRLRSARRPRQKAESTIALINVVFLLLVFFLVAGTLSAARDTSVELAEAQAFDPTALDPAAIYIDATGTLLVGGDALAPEAAIARVVGLAPDGDVTIVPDRNLDAREMLFHLARLRAATDRPLKILTRRTVGVE